MYQTRNSSPHEPTREGNRNDKLELQTPITIASFLQSFEPRAPATVKAILLQELNTGDITKPSEDAEGTAPPPLPAPCVPLTRALGRFRGLAEYYTSIPIKFLKREWETFSEIQFFVVVGDS